MIEKNLEDFEEFYTEKINNIFSKIKKVLKKLILEIRENLIEIKVCLDHFLEIEEGKIDQKAQKSLHFFSDRIRKEIDEIEVPEEDITYDNTLDLLNSIKRLFTSINEIARKSLPKFQKEVQPQIKELNYISSAGLGVFMGFIETVRENEGDIKLTSMSPKIFRVFDLLGFPTLYDILENEDEAIKKFA